MNILHVACIGLGIWLGTTFRETVRDIVHDIVKLHQAFYENEQTPSRLVQFVPKSIRSTFSTCKFLSNYAWTKMEQTLRRTCVKQGKYYHLRFVIENKVYALVVKPERGPSSEVEFYSPDGTKCPEIRSYVRGASNIVLKITPALLGYEKLSTALGNEFLNTFTTHEIIQI